MNYKYNIGDRLKDDNRDLTIIDRRIKNDRYKQYKYRCNKCGYECGESYHDQKYEKEYWIYENHLHKGIGCACCSRNRAVVKGINDIHTTNKYLESLLANKDDAYKYSQNSSQKVLFTCPYCGREKLEKITNVRRYGLRCRYCSSHVSYGERFMTELLSYINVDFIKEMTSTTFKWVGKYRYDFYIPINNTIIEVNGIQHYEDNIFTHKSGITLQGQQDIDLKKKKLALKNGIKNYIVIDSSNPDFNVLIENVKNNKFSDLFDISNVDWDYIKSNAEKSICVQICKYWEQYKNKTTTDLAKHFHLSPTTISTYLHRGNELGICEYNVSKGGGRRKNIYIDDTVNTAHPIKCLENNIYFKSCGLCARLSKEVFNIQLDNCSIRSVLQGKYSHHRNYHFEYVTQNEFNEAHEHGLLCYGSPFKL